MSTKPSTAAELTSAVGPEDAAAAGVDAAEAEAEAEAAGAESAAGAGAEAEAGAGVEGALVLAFFLAIITTRKSLSLNLTPSSVSSLPRILPGDRTHRKGEPNSAGRGRGRREARRGERRTGRW